MQGFTFLLSYLEALEAALVCTFSGMVSALITFMLYCLIIFAAITLLATIRELMTRIFRT